MEGSINLLTLSLKNLDSQLINLVLKYYINLKKRNYRQLRRRILIFKILEITENQANKENAKDYNLKSLLKPFFKKHVVRKGIENS